MVVGDLRFHKDDRRATEVIGVAVRVMNRTLVLGGPTSVRVA